MNSKQKDEKRDVEDFLKTLGRQPVDIKPGDRPDVIPMLHYTDKPNTRRVGIEHTKYFVDDSQRQGSPGKRLNNFWAAVSQEIEDLRNKSGSLEKIHAYVTLNKQELFNGSRGPSPKKLAAELFGFVTEASETVTSDVIVIPDWKEREFHEFNGYACLEKYVTLIRVAKGFSAYWDANVNTAHVGVDPRRLARVVRDKSEKARDYDRDGLDELWLLFAASHDTVFNAMHSCPEQIDFEDAELAAACKISPFDKVFFWSSKPHEWCAQIHPATPRPVGGTQSSE